MTAIAIGDSTRGAPCLRVEQCKAFSDDRRTDGGRDITKSQCAVQQCHTPLARCQTDGRRRRTISTET